jgi:hypothetical protein
MRNKYFEKGESVMAESERKVFLHGQSGRTAYGIKEYTVDDASGVSELPVDVHIGSSCLVISTGEIYMLNSQRNWIKVPSTGGSGGGSAEEPQALTEEEIMALINGETEGENDGE